MAEKKKSISKPAKDPESRENQLINLAVTLAEKQLKNGKASSAVITHYLKLATSRERLEREILEKQAKLIEAKVSTMGKDGEMKKLAQEAIEAMKNYGPK